VREASQLGKLAAMQRTDKFCLCWMSVFFAFCFVACDRLIPSRYNQLVQDADARTAQGDFNRAINLYEAALDDNPRCAEIHYKLALLYDDKLSDPVGALHHYRRYIALSPNGPHANDAKNSIRRDELAAVTSLSGDSMVTRAEAARLRNENLSLHKQLDSRAATSQSAASKLQTRDATSTKTAKKSGERTYTVRKGDTLASISRKFYKSSTRWQRILEANKNSIRDPKNLTVGQTLVIP
jgi:tetratricopeptide (TPR) repeat protein